MPHPKRKKCPFYGFLPVGKYALLDYNGKYCAINKILNPKSSVFCTESKNWRQCHHNCKENSQLILTIIKNYTIYPDQERPCSKIIWEGIPFKEWYKKF